MNEPENKSAYDNSEPVPQPVILPALRDEGSEKSAVLVLVPFLRDGRLAVEGSLFTFRAASLRPAPLLSALRLSYAGVLAAILPRILPCNAGLP